MEINICEDIYIYMITSYNFYKTRLHPCLRDNRHTFCGTNLYNFHILCFPTDLMPMCAKFSYNGTSQALNTKIIT